MSNPRLQDIRFIEHLEVYVPRDPPVGGTRERGDRGALAALRRGLGKDVGAVPEMYPYVVPWLPRDQAPGWEWREHAYYLVASLFGLYPSIWFSFDTGNKRSTLGTAMLQLARRIEANTGNHESADARFAALLNTTTIDLPEHLRHAISLLKARDVPVDWAQLLRDVQDWTVPYRPVQRAWARAYWASSDSNATDVPGDDSDSEADTEVPDDV